MNTKFMFALYGIASAVVGGVIVKYVELVNISQAIEDTCERKISNAKWEQQRQIIDRSCETIVDEAIIRMKVVKAFEQALENHINVKKEEEV